MSRKSCKQTSDNAKRDPFRINKWSLLRLLVYIIVLEHQSIANGQQNSSSASSSSLPSLSERAGGLNSRYLSASGTASLAAATVAASNQQQSQQQQPSSTTSALQANQDANRSFLVHQQQQQQQQQQQTHQATSNNGLSGQQQGLNQQQQLTQYTSFVQPATTQQQTAPVNGNNNGQQQTQTPPPTLSTRYSYNPATGQYIPLDSYVTAGSSANPAVNVAASSFGSSQQQQQQQQTVLPAVLNNGAGNSLLGGTNIAQASGFNPATVRPQFGVNSNTFGVDLRGQQVYQPSQLVQVNQNQRPVQHITLGNHPYTPYSNWQRISPQSFGGAPIYGSTGGSSQYSIRRNGLLAQPNRVGGGGGVFNGGASVDDDSNGLFTQQQQPQYLFEQQQPSNEPNGYGGLPGGGGYFVNTNNQQQSPFQQQDLQQTPQQVSQSAHNNDLIASSRGFNSDQCVAADNRHGTCYPASECIRRGGTPMGRCGLANGLANQLSIDTLTSGSSHVCCLFDITCGQFATERFVYFRNPNYPNTFDQSRMCRAKIGKLDKGMCQFRLDLLRFDVAKPTNGNCSTDMFVVSGQNENYVIPKICGFNDGQHYYVGVDESGVITLHMMMMGFYRRSFEILITQIPCRSDYAAPAHCLQHFIGTHGTIKSFNYDDEQLYGSGSNQPFDFHHQQQQQLDPFITNGGPGGPTAPYGLQFGAASNAIQHRQLLHRFGQNNVVGSSQADHFGGYPNDMDYTICIRKESGFCSITYQLSRGEQGLQPFAIGPTGAWLNETGGVASTSSNGQWFPVSNECRDDYLLIGGVKLCSSSSGAAAAGSNQQYNPFYDLSGNNSSLNGYGQQQRLQQNLQSQYNQLVQQLGRLQQQQQQQFLAAATGGSPVNSNVTYASTANNQAQQNNQLGVGLDGINNSSGNLEQQQAAIMQQLLFTQQQLNLLANNNGNGRYGLSNTDINGQVNGDWPNAFITDTTSGPFLLRFVSNMARNARGFHIDYRQNPCK